MKHGSVKRHSVVSTTCHCAYPSQWSQRFYKQQRASDISIQFCRGGCGDIGTCESSLSGYVDKIVGIVSSLGNDLFADRFRISKHYTKPNVQK